MSKQKTRFGPRNPLFFPRVGDIATFNRLPYVPEIKGQDVDVAIIGAPFDGGSTYRPGARFGPRAVRDASALNRNFNPHLGVGVFDRLSVVDGGDIATNPLNYSKTMAAIEARVRAIHQAGARVITVGGDHAITLPILRATRAKFGEFTLLQFDAHTDANDQAWGEKQHHGTWVRRAIEEGILQGSHVFQLGIRGPLTSPEDYVTEQGFNVLGAEAFEDTAQREAFFKKLRKSTAKRPLYVTFDVDGVDPAFAPGTGTPVVGGLSSREALSALRAIKGSRLIGGDVVEIAPAYDHAELTSLLAAAVIFEYLSLMAG